MQRKEQFAFGAALIAATLAVILSKSLAWLILIIGLGFVFDFYVRDLIWGPTDLLVKRLNICQPRSMKRESSGIARLRVG
jgi:hypothetical protein